MKMKRRDQVFVYPHFCTVLNCMDSFRLLVHNMDSMIFVCDSVRRPHMFLHIRHQPVFGMYPHNWLQSFALDHRRLAVVFHLHYLRSNTNFILFTFSRSTSADFGKTNTFAYALCMMKIHTQQTNNKQFILLLMTNCRNVDTLIEQHKGHDWFFFCHLMVFNITLLHIYNECQRNYRILHTYTHR